MLFRSLLRATYEHWPESHIFQPENEDHLRAWLLIRAKHCTIKSFYMDSDASENARLIPFVMATMTGKHAWARAKGNELQVCVANLIAFDKCPHQLFCKLCDDIAADIKNETGMDADELLRARDAA